MKPRLFVGSSVEAIQIAYALQSNLRHSAEVTVWDQGIFRVSNTALQSLASALEDFDFAAFIFSPDDLALIREVEQKTVRDNVIFELGLFIGKLGASRCFFLTPDGDDQLHLPTDLLGVKPATYDRDRSDGNWRAATGPASSEIRQELQRQGPRLALVDQAEGTAPSLDSSETTPKRPEVPPPSEEAKQAQQPQPRFDPWIEAFVENRFDDALAAVEAALASETETPKALDLHLWRPFILFQISPQRGEAAYRQVAAEYPDDPRPWSQLAAALVSAGFLERALAVSGEAMQLLPKHPEIIGARARTIEAANGTADAEAFLEGEIKAAPEIAAPLLTQLARLRAQRGDTAAALEVITNALRDYPYSTELLEQRGQLLLASNASAEAVAVFRQLIVLKPKEPSYHALMGNALLDLSLFGAALEAYQQADALAESKQGWIVANIGNLFNNRGFHALSIERLEAALRLDPQSDYTQDRLLSARRNRASEWQRLESLVSATLSKGEPAAQSGGNA